MSSLNAKATHIVFSKTNSIYAVFNDQSFNDTLVNDIVSFKQLGAGFWKKKLVSLLLRSFICVCQSMFTLLLGVLRTLSSAIFTLSGHHLYTFVITLVPNEIYFHRASCLVLIKELVSK